MPILSADARERARRIRLVLFDVDGVLTDGTIWFYPLPQAAANPATIPAENIEGPVGASASMVEVKGFSAHDGIGLALAKRAGIQIGVITKRHSASLALRARDLRMDFVRQGVERKRQAMEAIMTDAGLTADQVCCMGDDIIDLPMLRHCGLAATPANGRPELRAEAHFIADNDGGHGAARDLMEFILKEQGKWDDVAAIYLQEAEGEALHTQ